MSDRHAVRLFLAVSIASLLGCGTPVARPTACERAACDPAATCQVANGIAVCSCKPGYVGDGVTCADVDECKVGNGGCAPAATCTNTPGGRTCGCQAGFTGDGVVCSACATCAAGQFEAAACTGTTDTVCSACDAGCVTCTGAGACTRCAAGTYLAGGVCLACATCGPTQYLASACSATANAVCNSCSACAAGKYRTAACAGTNDTACSTCSVCGAGEYASAACGASSNTACASCDADCLACTGADSCTACAPGTYLSGGICVTCSTCMPGEYRTAACTATADTSCAVCSTCATGQYQTAGCGASTDTVCQGCATCGAGSYQTAACAGTANTACSSCSTCSAGQYRSADCTATSNTSCVACSTCGASQYQAASCGPSTNTVCQSCSTCSAGNYRSGACGGSNDTTCSGCSSCGAGQYQAASCATAADTVCANCATCPAGSYVTAACSATSNTQCASCGLHCDLCSAAGACTTCAAPYALFGTQCVLAGTSCKSILAANPSAPDGTYKLDPDGGSAANAFLALCDMTHDGGGWMKILQYSTDGYTPSRSGFGPIAVAGTSAPAKLSDLQINSLDRLAAYREYRFQGALSTKKLFLKVNTYWDDPSQAHNLMAAGTGLACEGTTTCTYVSVGHQTIDSNDWSPSSIAGANNEDRYFTDYGNVAWPECYATGSTTTRCYSAGATTGHALIPDFSIWAREATPGSGLIIHYPLDENGGTVINDFSGDSRTATLISGSWTTGQFGGAMLGALKTDARVPLSNEVTVSMWVRRDGPNVGNARLFGWDGDGLELFEMDEQLAIYTPRWGWAPVDAFLDTGYHHIAVTVAPDDLSVYLDGLEVMNTSHVGVNLQGHMYVGARWTGEETWNGAIDQVRVYDRRLTAAEILTLSQE